MQYLLRLYVEDNKKAKRCPTPGYEYAVEFVLGSGCYDISCKCSKYEYMFKASISQMGRLCSLCWTRMDTCRDEIVSHFRTNPSIFVPLMDDSNQESVTPGMFLLLD